MWLWCAHPIVPWSREQHTPHRPQMDRSSDRQVHTRVGPEKMLEGVLLRENPRMVELAEGSAGGLYRGQRGPGSI